MSVALPPIIMTRRAFERLPEYSTTLPTGTTPGKRWRRDVYLDGEEWWLGRYGDPVRLSSEHVSRIPIYWRRIIVQGTPPRWPRDCRVDTPQCLHPPCPTPWPWPS